MEWPLVARTTTSCNLSAHKLLLLSMGACVRWPDLTISGSSNWIPAKITQPIYKTCYSHTREYSHFCTRASISNTRARTRTRIFTTRTGSLLAFLVLDPSLFKGFRHFAIHFLSLRLLKLIYRSIALNSLAQFGERPVKYRSLHCSQQRCGMFRFEVSTLEDS